MWKNIEQDCNQDSSNKSTIASKGKIWIAPEMTENIEWENKVLLIQLVAHSTLSPEPCCAYTRTNSLAQKKQILDIQISIVISLNFSLLG